MPERREIEENPEVLERIKILAEVGQEVFGSSHAAETGEVNGDDVRLADDFLYEGARRIDPPIRAHWWEHVGLATEFARRMSGDDPGVTFAMKLHDIDKWINPQAKYRSDQIAAQLHNQWGIGQPMKDNLFSFGHLLKAGEAFIPPSFVDKPEDELSDQQRATLEERRDLFITPEQRVGEESIRPEQEEYMREFVQKLPFNHILTYVADTLGKRDFTDRQLFDLPALYAYLQGESERYKLNTPELSHWGSIAHLQKNGVAYGAVGPQIALTMVAEMVDRLQDSGIDVEGVHRTLEDYGPRFIVLARHGEIDNPRDLDYGQDEHMNPADIVELSDLGRAQMVGVATIVRERQLPDVQIIVSSPARRVQQSAEIVATDLGIENIVVDEHLNEFRSPGGYKRGYTLTQLRDLEETPEWPETLASMKEEYDHEEPSDVSERVYQGFWNVASQLEAGQSGIILSHGLPLALLKQGTLLGQHYRGDIRERQPQPPKGSAQLVVINPDDTIAAAYFLKK